jgi:lysozyme family protein
MAKFEPAVEVVLAHEGGYSFDPDDPGGETNHGISKRSYPSEDILALTVDRAKELYERDFWKYEEVESQVIATKLLDMAVNMGSGQAVKLLQQALKIPVDGVFGPHTLAATNGAEPERLLHSLRAKQAAFYARLVLTHVALAKYLDNWMDRATF